MSSLSDLDRDGFIKIPDFVDCSFINRISKSIDLVINSATSPFFRDLSSGQDSSFLSDIWSSHFAPNFSQSYIPDELPILISNLMEASTVILLQDTWFRRTSTCSTAIPWHHDQSIEGPFYSVWISLTDIPPQDSLHFVKGSHKSGLRYLPQSFFSNKTDSSSLNAMESFYRSFHYSSSNDYASHFCPVPSDIDTSSNYEVVSVPTNTGDLIIFNGLTLHSLPSSFRSSCGFVLRWISDTSVVSPYSNDSNIASKLLNVDLQTEKTISDPFFKRFSFR